MAKYAHNRILGFILLATFVIPTKMEAQTNQTVKNYIALHQDLVVHLADSFGIPATLIMGVAIVESGAGNSKLARLLHNHFGIKASNHYQVINGYKTRFKYYESDSASFTDFCLYLKRRKYYAALKGNFDYNAWLNAMAKSGYSGSPKTWKSKVKYTVIHYKLTELVTENVKQP